MRPDMYAEPIRSEKPTTRVTAFLAVLLAAGFLPETAHAYVGPTVGIGLIGAAIGLLLTVIMAIGVIVSWPLRRLKRRRQAAKAAPGESEPSADGTD